MIFKMLRNDIVSAVLQTNPNLKRNKRKEEQKILWTAALSLLWDWTLRQTQILLQRHPSLFFFWRNYLFLLNNGNKKKIGHQQIFNT